MADDNPNDPWFVPNGSKLPDDHIEHQTRNVPEVEGSIDSGSDPMDKKSRTISEKIEDSKLAHLLGRHTWVRRSIMGGFGVAIAITSVGIGYRLWEKYFSQSSSSEEVAIVVSETAAVPSPLEQKVKPRMEVTPWLTFPSVVTPNRLPEIGSESPYSKSDSPNPKVVVVDPSPEVIYSDTVSSSDLTPVVAATPSLEKAVDPAPVILVSDIISTNSFPIERDRLLKTSKLESKEDKFDSYRIYEQAVNARDRLFGKSTLSEIAPKPVVPSLPVFPENALLELTLQGVCCAPPNWYDRFTAPESFRKENFLALFHQYVKERGAAEFLKDYQRDDYFDVFAISHSMESGYCAKARMFGDRVDQWVGDNYSEAKRCVLHHKCK